MGPHARAQSWPSPRSPSDELYGEGYWPKGRITRAAGDALVVDHPSLGRWRLAREPVEGASSSFLFTENETNAERQKQGAERLLRGGHLTHGPSW